MQDPLDERDRRALEVLDGVRLQPVLAGFDFDTVWKERRVFRDESAQIPVARLSHIVASKAAAGRPKDRLFLASHEEALRELLQRREGRKAP